MQMMLAARYETFQCDFVPRSHGAQVVYYINRAAELIIRVGEQARVHMAMRANEGQVGNCRMKITRDLPLGRVWRKITVVHKGVRPV